MRQGQREQFNMGAGAPVVTTLGSLTCSVCGFTHENRKLFKREGDGHVCTTGHYEDDEGNAKRARNPYAR